MTEKIAVFAVLLSIFGCAGAPPAAVATVQKTQGSAPAAPEPSLTFRWTAPSRAQVTGTSAESPELAVKFQVVVCPLSAGKLVLSVQDFELSAPSDAALERGGVTADSKAAGMRMAQRISDALQVVVSERGELLEIRGAEEVLAPELDDVFASGPAPTAEQRAHALRQLAEPLLDEVRALWEVTVGAWIAAPLEPGQRREADLPLRDYGEPVPARITYQRLPDQDGLAILHAERTAVLPPAIAGKLLALAAPNAQATSNTVVRHHESTRLSAGADLKPRRLEFESRIAADTAEGVKTLLTTSSAYEFEWQTLAAEACAK